MNMTWIDDIILGLKDTYNTTDPYDLCNLLKIFVKKVDGNYPILYKEPATYIRNFYRKEANYFTFKLIEIKFSEVEVYQMTIEQIASCLEVPGDALKQLVKI